MRHPLIVKNKGISHQKWRSRLPLVVWTILRVADHTSRIAASGRTLMNSEEK